MFIGNYNSNDSIWDKVEQFMAPGEPNSLNQTVNILITRVGTVKCHWIVEENPHIHEENMWDPRNDADCFN